MQLAAPAKSDFAMRFALLGAALVLVGGFAFKRHLRAEQRRREVAESVRVNSARRITPWEYMARTEGHIFLQRSLGSLRYPKAAYMVNPEHPLEVYFESHDAPKTIADYYSKQLKLKVKSSGAGKTAKYESQGKMDRHRVSIVISPSSKGSIIEYSLPDMRPPGE